MKYSGPNNMAMIIPKKCDAKLPVLPTHTVAVIYANIPKNSQISIIVPYIIILARFFLKKLAEPVVGSSLVLVTSMILVLVFSIFYLFIIINRYKITKVGNIHVGLKPEYFRLSSISG